MSKCPNKYLNCLLQCPMMFLILYFTYFVIAAESEEIDSISYLKNDNELDEMDFDTFKSSDVHNYIELDWFDPKMFDLSLFDEKNESEMTKLQSLEMQDKSDDWDSSDSLVQKHAKFDGMSHVHQKIFPNNPEIKDFQTSNRLFNELKPPELDESVKQNEKCSINDKRDETTLATIKKTLSDQNLKKDNVNNLIKDARLVWMHIGKCNTGKKVLSLIKANVLFNDVGKMPKEFKKTKGDFFLIGAYRRKFHRYGGAFILKIPKKFHGKSQIRENYVHDHNLNDFIQEFDDHFLVKVDFRRSQYITVDFKKQKTASTVSFSFPHVSIANLIKNRFVGEFCGQLLLFSLKYIRNHKYYFNIEKIDIKSELKSCLSKITCPGILPDDISYIDGQAFTSKQSEQVSKNVSTTSFEDICKVYRKINDFRNQTIRKMPNVDGSVDKQGVQVESDVNHIIAFDFESFINYDKSQKNSKCSGTSNNETLKSLEKHEENLNGIDLMENIHVPVNIDDLINDMKNRHFDENECLIELDFLDDTNPLMI